VYVFQGEVEKVCERENTESERHKKKQGDRENGREGVNKFEHIVCVCFIES